MTELIQKEEKKLSIKEVIQISKEYALEVLKYSWLMVICAVLFGKLMYNRKMSTPTTYTADFSFAFNEAVSENKNSIASIFGGGSFLGGESGGSQYNFAKLEEMVKTRKIILNLLFHKITLKNDESPREDFVINHYLEKFYYKRKREPEHFYFTVDTIDAYNIKANYFLKYVHAAILREHLILDPTTNMMHIKAVSTSEDFSYELVMALYKEISKYYDEQSTGQKKRFYEMAQERTMQLKGKLHGAEARYIEHVNTNGAEAGGRNNIIIETQYLATELKNATESYFAALKTMEAAWVAYESQRQIPSIIVIDPPLYPLTVSAPNPFIHMVLGVILGAGLAFVGIILRKFARDYFQKAAQEPENELVPNKESEKVV